MVKSIKLKKKYYKDLEALLKDAGLVDVEANRAYPSNLVVNPVDYKKIRREIVKAFKKEYPYSIPRRIQAGVEMHLLNLGPNENVAVRPGYAIIVQKESNDI
jgi:hypothetical protein